MRIKRPGEPELEIAGIGKHNVPLWLIIIFISGSVLGVLAVQLWQTVTIPVEVKEPIEIIDYPSQLSLFPGETENFTIKVKNHASTNYSVVLDFQLDNTTYQDNYVASHNETYSINPGKQNLTTWLEVYPDAPPITVSLTITLRRQSFTFMRTEELKITKVEFLTGNNINITLQNTGTSPITVNEIFVSGGSNLLSSSETLSSNSQSELQVSYTWSNGDNYQIRVVTLKGNQFYYNAVAPST